MQALVKVARAGTPETAPATPPELPKARVAAQR